MYEPIYILKIVSIKMGTDESVEPALSFVGHTSKYSHTSEYSLVVGTLVKAEL